MAALGELPLGNPATFRVINVQPYPLHLIYQRNFHTNLVQFNGDL